MRILITDGIKITHFEHKYLQRKNGIAKRKKCVSTILLNEKYSQLLSNNMNVTYTQNMSIAGFCALLNLKK